MAHEHWLHLCARPATYSVCPGRPSSPSDGLCKTPIFRIPFICVVLLTAVWCLRRGCRGTVQELSILLVGKCHMISHIWSSWVSWGRMTLPGHTQREKHHMSSFTRRVFGSYNVVKCHLTSGSTAEVLGTCWHVFPRGFRPGISGALWG